jgi:hypothetical protein
MPVLAPNAASCSNFKFEIRQSANPPLPPGHHQSWANKEMAGVGEFIYSDATLAADGAGDHSNCFQGFPCLGFM